MTLSAEQKAERARQILDNEVFQEAMERAKTKIMDRWTQATSEKEREGLWHRYHALDAVRVALNAIEGDGQMARHKRERQEKRSG